MQKTAPIKAANRILKLWQDYGPNQNIVDLEFIVEEVVNKTSGQDRLSLAHKTLPAIDGAMVRSTSSPNSYAAMVNDEITNQGRKRFTLGHEIGHFVLHRKLQAAFKCSRNMLEDFKTEGIELEANQFSAQLLLPPNRVREFAKRPWNTDTLIEVAETFQVSLQAAGLRMAQLSHRPIAFVVSSSDMVEWGVSSPPLYKKGCFFRSMDDVPECSTAYGSDFSDERLETEFILSNEWRIHESFKEVSMTGYDMTIYTCIDVV